MNKLVIAFLAAGAAIAASPAVAATEVTVVDIGAVFNQSLALPAEDTPGSGIGFEQFFEFTLPVKETVTLSVSDSATGAQRITSGLLSLNHFTSSAPISPFEPIGAVIDSVGLSNFLGGQSAELGPDIVNAGAYFAEVSGVSGLAPIHIAIDGTVTASSVPEPATWAMLVLGFGLMGLGAVRQRRFRLFPGFMQGNHA